MESISIGKFCTCGHEVWLEDDKIFDNAEDSEHYGEELSHCPVCETRLVPTNLLANHPHDTDDTEYCECGHPYYRHTYTLGGMTLCTVCDECARYVKVEKEAA